MTELSIIVHPDRTILSNTLELIAYAPSEKKLLRDAICSNASAGEQTKRRHSGSNRIEQDRTRSIDKTMTELSIFCHPDRTILSNTLELIAYAPFRKKTPLKHHRLKSLC